MLYGPDQLAQSGWGRVGTRSTPADGTYSFSGLQPGAYRICVDEATGLAPECYHDKADVITADSIVAARNTTTTADMTLGVAQLSNTASPTISDTTPTAGQALTATSGTWSPGDGAYAYQWLADGAAITGATGSGYAAGAGDVGKALSVRVTASRAGWTSSSATSAPTSAVVDVVTPPPTPPPPTTPPPAPPTTATTTPAPPSAVAPVPLATAPATITCPAPKVGGKFTVGKKVKAVVGTVTPSGVSMSYQWLRNGKPIKKATKAAYKLTVKDKRRRIGVRVTYVRSGYPTVVKRSTAKRVR